MENSIESLKDKVEKNLEIRRNPEKQRKQEVKKIREVENYSREPIPI